jgi:uncharacterized protein YaaW (UPF0174 family)
MNTSINSNERLKQLFLQCSKEDLKEIYQRHGIEGQHNNETVGELVDRIRLDGSNTLVSVARGWEGVNYDEIVKDVADKVKVSYKKNGLLSEKEFEPLIVEHLVKIYFEKLTEEQKVEFEKSLKSLGKEYNDFWKTLMTGGSGAILFIAQTIGRKAMAKIIQAIISKMILATGAMVTTTRLAALAVPFLNILVAVWTIIDIAGPAYRKTVPTVFQVALLRLQYSAMEGEI